MAEDKGRDEFAPEVDDLEEGDEDILFKAQMGIYQFFATNWKPLLGMLGVFLLGTLVYSLVSDHLRQQQREQHAAINEIDRRMPPPDPLAAFGMAPADDPEDADRMANLKEGARRYGVIADEGSGTAAVMSRLKEAGVHARIGDDAARLAALEKANEAGSKGILGWSATSQLAAARADAGDVDGAASLLESVNSTETGFIAEQALLDLGMLYEGAGRTDDAVRVLEDFTTRYPESIMTPQAAEVLGRLKG